MQTPDSNADSAKLSDTTIAKALRAAAPRKLSRLFFDSDRPFYILDGRDRLRFANLALLNALATTEADLIGLDCGTGPISANDSSTALRSQLSIPSSARRLGLHLEPLACDVAGLVTQEMKWGGRLILSLDSDFGNGSIGCWWLRSDDKLVQQMSRSHDWSQRKEIQYAIALSRQAFSKPEGVYSLVGTHPSTCLARQQIKVAIESSASLLIRGPSGAGKSMLAQAVIHGRAKHLRRSTDAGRLLTIECRLMDRALMSEMLELAREQTTATNRVEAPTMLLKGINRLPVETLTLLADFFRQHPTTNCIATADSHDLGSLHGPNHDWKAVLAFVSTLSIEILSLHRRPEDIAPTASVILDDLQSVRPPKERKHFSPACLRSVEAYAWPGEIRELVYALQYAETKTTSLELELRHFPLAVRTFASHVLKPEAPREIDLEKTLEEVETRLIRAAIELFPRNRAAAARHLGISRTKLLRRLNDLGIESVDSESRSDSVLPAEESTGKPSAKASEIGIGAAKPSRNPTSTTTPAKEPDADVPIFIELANDETRHE